MSLYSEPALAVSPSNALCSRSAKLPLTDFRVYIFHIWWSLKLVTGSKCLNFAVYTSCMLPRRLRRCHSKFDRSEIRSRRQNLLGNTIAERFNLLGNTVAPRKYYRTLALHLPSTQRTWHSLVDFDLCSNVPRPQSGLTPAFLAGWERLM